jgi:pimeloyl-ACP methyl ester carboxylesterase
MQHTVNGITLNVREQGEGEPALVFLHYFGGSSRAWSQVINQCAGDYRCIAPDLRGFGDSAGPATGYTVNTYADDVADLLRVLQIERYVMIGHSMGGKIALALAARQPPGLRSLVLVAPSPPTPEPMSDDERTHLLDGYGDRAAAEKTADKITAVPLPAQVREQVIEDNLRSSYPAWVTWLEYGSREDISATMSGVAVPLLVVAGAEDPVMPANMLEREVVQRIAGARMAVVPQAGHLMPLEAPTAIADLVRGWV